MQMQWDESILKKNFQRRHNLKLLDSKKRREFCTILSIDLLFTQGNLQKNGTRDQMKTREYERISNKSGKTISVSKSAYFARWRLTEKRKPSVMHFAPLPCSCKQLEVSEFRN